jgi:hypothetical protein
MARPGPDAPWEEYEKALRDRFPGITDAEVAKFGAREILFALDHAPAHAASVYYNPTYDAVYYFSPEGLTLGACTVKVSNR